MNIGDKFEHFVSLLRKIDALAVENAALKESLAELRRKAFSGRHNSHNCGPFQYSDLCESIIESTKIETTATDAALAAVEARGVEKFADSEQCSQEAHSCAYCYLDGLRGCK